MRVGWIGFFALALTIDACGVRPVPSMPSVSTKIGRDCLMECQREHRHCGSACQGMLLEEKTCLSQCNQLLQDCYRLCLEDDRSMVEHPEP